MPDIDFTTESSSPDKLLGGEFPRAPRTVLITGGAALAAGSLLGRTHTAPAVPVGAADAGNTGDGVIGAITADDGAKAGVWRAVCIEPGANVGTFAVFDPDGAQVGTAVVAVAFNGGINFTIADGATDFIAGDAFSITVVEGTEAFQLSLAAAVDGSQVPCAVLTEATDPSGGDVLAGVFLTGEFDERAITFGTGHTVANTRQALARVNIYLRPTVGVA